MSSSDPAAGRLRLPVNPSLDHLRKQAKRLHGQRPDLTLQQAQHQLAKAYGFRHWDELSAVVANMHRGADQLVNVDGPKSKLADAANANDLAAVRAILAGDAFTQHDLDLALARAVLSFDQRHAIAELLITHGADPDGQYGSNYGPIALVAGECLDPRGLQFLIDHGANVAFGPLVTKYGQATMLGSVLGTYVRGENRRKQECIRILLDHGAPLPGAVTPEILAVHRDDPAELARLLDADTGLLSRLHPAMPYGNVALTGGSLLHCAVEFDALACIGLLLDRGADVNQRAMVIDGVGGQTPMFHAINTWWEVKLATLELLVQRAGGQLDPTIAATFRLHDGPRTAPLSAIAYAAEPGDPKWRKHAERERELLAGLASGPASHERLWQAVQRQDVVEVARLLAGGADANQRDAAGSGPLHDAAEHGPVALVELLLAHGGRTWLTDAAGRTPLGRARAGSASDQAEIVHLLGEVRVLDPLFRQALVLFDAGDADGLAGLLCRHPTLIHQRAEEEGWFAGPYFRHPTLLHFAAGNPIRPLPLPANLCRMVKVLLAAGADIAARTDDPKGGGTVLGLVASGAAARAQGLQIPLIELLVARGGAADEGLAAAVQHGEEQAIAALLRLGARHTLDTAAGLGEVTALRALLDQRPDQQRLLAAAQVAALRGQAATLALLLDAGVGINDRLPHPYAPTLLHQAAWNGHRALVEHLLACGADCTLRDRQYDGTPADWAHHGGHPALAAWLGLGVIS